MASRLQRVLLFGLGLAGCASHRPPLPNIPLTPSAQLCDDPSLGDKELCLPFAKMAAVLKTAQLDIVQVKNPDSGTAGAKALVVSVAEQKLVFKAKWKLSDRGGDGFNNSPRKEIAAYEFQKLFLAPDEYVVPPTVGRCLPADPVTGRPPRARDRTFAEANCVFGVLSYWLEHVTDRGVLDRERFARDAAYRISVANLNVLTFLIDHRDTRPANFLISTDPRRPRVFAIDNGLAFSGFRNPRAAFVHEWNYIVVPALARAEIERLRRITRAELDRLAVVTQYRIKDGALEEVTPTAPLPHGDGVRRDGDTIQLGLTRREIDSLESRLKKLLAMVDRGAIALF
jgi:hypothetical protein